MGMTDPISDYLTLIRNAVRAEKKIVDIPNSKFKTALTEILKSTGYITDYKIFEIGKGKSRISLRLKYRDGKCVINGLRKISKPGIRRYAGSEKLPRVRGGLGIAIISTSQGLMTDKQARKLNTGGEVICEIW